MLSQGSAVFETLKERKSSSVMGYLSAQPLIKYCSMNRLVLSSIGKSKEE
jgi:hypothetical protein